MDDAEAAATISGPPTSHKPQATNHPATTYLVLRTIRADTRVRPYEEMTHHEPQATSHLLPFPDSPGETDRVSRDPGPMQRATPRIRPPSTSQPQATGRKLPFSGAHAAREAGVRLLPILERRGRF